jgi:phospho-N-acetylmuramoyl-pentapeptide-transferase
MREVLFSFLVAFLISIIIAYPIILSLRKLKADQNILNYVELHKEKQGTATMGGFIFIIGFIISSIVFFNQNNILSYMILVVTLGYFLIGFLDDFLKIKKKQNEGLKPYQKIIGQGGLAILSSLFIYYNEYIGTTIMLPFSFKVIDIGILIIPLSIFIYIATTNSVNLTDGLDGLSGGVSIVYLISFIVYMLCYYIYSYTIGSSASYLNELHNIMISCGAMSGGLLAFLVFNNNKASVFMGDCGSLAIGGFISSISLFSRTELIIPIMGLMFVISSLSDIIQVLHYKRTKKRVFLMAPFHHHLQMLGMNESKIVGIYMIITTIVCVLSIAFVMGGINVY